MSAETLRWVTVEVFGQRSLAEVAGSVLRGAGIPHRVLADDAGATHPPLSLRTSGVELQVHDEDLEDARAMLMVDVAADADDAPADAVRRTGMTTVANLALLGIVVLLVVVAAADALFG